MTKVLSQSLDLNDSMACSIALTKGVLMLLEIVNECLSNLAGRPLLCRAHAGL